MPFNHDVIDTAYFRRQSNGATVLDRGRLTFVP